MKNFGFRLVIIFLSLMFSAKFCWANIDRRELVNKTYAKLPNILSSLLKAELIEQRLAREFLVAISAFYNNDVQPKLVYDSDSSKFIINPGERPHVAPENIVIDGELDFFINNEVSG